MNELVTDGYTVSGISPVRECLDKDGSENNDLRSCLTKRYSETLTSFEKKLTGKR